MRGFGLFGVDDFAPFADADDINLPQLGDYWYFLWDEYIDQGGEEIFFLINGNDDPPVFAFYFDRLIELAPTFSQFQFFHYWDWKSRYVPFDVTYYTSLKHIPIAPPVFHTEARYDTKSH